MTFFPDSFERGVNFTGSSTGPLLGVFADKMIRRAMYDGFTHGQMVISLAGTLTGTDVGVGPMNEGGPSPSVSSPNTNYGTFTYGRNDLTTADSSIRVWLQKAQDLGFTLKLRPWIYPSAWRGSMNPGGADPRDQAAFHTLMTNLRAATNHYAHLAAEYAPVASFSIGSEYARFTPDLYPAGQDGFPGAAAEWTNILTDVRAIVGPDAKLSYGSNEFAGNGRPTEWNLQTWMNHPDLDYVGIDQYGSLGTLNERGEDGTYLTARQVNGRLRFGVPKNLFGVINGPAYMGKVFPDLYTKYGKPIIFEEYGFSARRTTTEDPISNPLVGVYLPGGRDEQVMIEAHKGFLESMQGQTWCAGAYVWEMNRRQSGLVVDDGTGRNVTGSNPDASSDLTARPVEGIYRSFYSKTSPFPPVAATRPSRRFR